MALEQVKQEIIEHAEIQARKILADAMEQAKKEMDTAHQLLDVFDTEVQESLKKEIDALEKKYEAYMKLAAKKIMLQQQKKLIDELFQELGEHLRELPQAEKTKLLAALFAAAKKQCTIGKVYCASGDVRLVQTLFPSVEQKNIIGGLIVENKEGTFFLDYSFDSIIILLREQKLQEVTALLLHP